MDNDSILSQNIEILVYGCTKEKFIDFANINRSSSVVYEKKSASKSSHSKSEHYNPAIKTEELAKLHANYCSKINKLQDLYDENKSNNVNKSEKASASVLRKDLEPHYFSWGDLRKSTVTISTVNFWINANFCLVSDMFLDPYVNNVIAGNVNLLVITFNSNDKDSVRKALSLYLKLDTDKSPSSIKYQSQKLLLQQGYYHSYNENIVLALCENPHLEPLGKCLLVGFGSKSHQISIDNVLKEFKIKTAPKVLMIDDTDFNDCETKIGEIYDWIFESHHKMKNALSLEEPEKKELREAIKKSFVAKHTDEKKECSMF